MKLVLKKGSTSQTVNIFVQNSSSTTGAGLTGLVFNSSGLTAYYVRPRAAAVAITLVTQTVTGAYSSGGFVEIDATNMPGWYRLDLPDAVLATGVDHVGVHLKGATNMAPLPLEIQLTNVDLNDGTRGGMTALPNAAAEASGGLYTRGTGAGQINQAANGQIDTNVERVRNAAINALISGRVDADAQALAANVVTAAAIATGAIDADALATDAVNEIRDAILNVVTGTADAGSTASAIVDAERTEATTDYWQHGVVEMTSGANIGQMRRITAFNAGNDTITIAPAFKSAVAAGDTYRIIHVLADGLRPITEGNEDVGVEADGHVHGDLKEWLGVAPLALTSQKVQAKDADAAQASVCTETRLSELDAATTGKAANEIDILKEAAVARRGTAQAGAAGSVTLDSGASAVTDFYKDAWVFLVSGTGAGQSRLVSAYNGTTKVATIVPNWVTNPDSTSVFILLPAARVAGSQLTADMRGTDNAALAASFSFTSGNVHAHIKAEDNIDFGALKKASINAEVDNALDTAIPVTPTADSVNERVKAIDDKLPAGSIGDATAANQTTILNRLGAWTGSGVNTILGAFKAVLSKVASLPTDIGGTGDPTTDSLEAIRDTAPMGTAMRGTDNAALASVCTEARLSELDAATVGKAANQVDLIKTETDKIALADAGAGVAGSLIEEVENRSVPGDAMALTAAERDSTAAALLDLANGIETGLTLRQAQRLTAAASAGKLSGAATTTVTIKNAVADSKTRITATVDADGNRSAITYDLA